jgi:hypothetical protein
MSILRSSSWVIGKSAHVVLACATFGTFACSSSDANTGATATGGKAGTPAGAPGVGAGGGSGALTSTGGAKATGGTSTGGISTGGTSTGGTSTGGLSMTGGSGGAGVPVTPAGGSGGGDGKSTAGSGGAQGGAAATGGSAGASAAGSGSGGATPSTGCGSAKAPASGTFTIDVGGTMREYILAYYGLEREANNEAIFVAGEGLPFQGNNLGWANSQGQDLAFLTAMMERFRGELCIDESRIFSTGFSFGGMMSFAVGCATNSVMRAIAPMAGNIQVSGCQDGSKPVAVMGFHGDDDTVVPIDGGRAGRDRFIERNGCTEQTMPVDPSWCDGVNASNEPCSCVSYQGCTAGYPVIWCEFNGPHTPAPNSAATIWNFFSQF